MKKGWALSIVLICVLLTGCSSLSNTTTKPRNGWEYKSILLMCSSIPTSSDVELDDFRCTEPGLRGSSTSYSSWSPVEVYLNDFGADGWELVGYNLTAAGSLRTDFMFIFKREK